VSWQSETDGCAALFDHSGQRKYLTEAERWRLLSASLESDRQTSALAQLLVYSGCRISEALALTPSRLDPGTGSVVFRTLKRRRPLYRAVPIPAGLMDELIELARSKGGDERLWRWCRQTAWRRVKALMAGCGITGAHATPKGCRHGFGIANAQQKIPVGTTKKWMGHARLETTAIYQNAVGEEELSFAKRLWARPKTAPTKDGRD